MINVMKSENVDHVAELACDDASDVANLTQYAEDNHLELGSTCLCVGTGAVYAMKSDKTWVEI